MCPVSMSKGNSGDGLVYEALNAIDRSFEEILGEFERLQKLEGFRKQEPVKAVELAVRETHAWTLFEILEIVHARAEQEWTRLGRIRSRLESGNKKPRRRSPK
jgi:hypothetical protein